MATVPRTGRSPKGRFEATPESAERQAEACRLRSRGMTYRDIAAAMGYTDHSTARYAVEQGMKAIVAEPAEEVRTRELERLDAMYAAALKVLETPHVMVSQGKVMRNDDDQPMPDDAPVLTAIDRLLKIQDRRAKLLGLDEDKRVTVNHKAESDFDRAYSELLEVMRERETPASQPQE